MVAIRTVQNRRIATCKDLHPHLLRISRDALGSNIQTRKVKDPVFKDRENNKMIKIVFMCLGGISTSFLEQKTSEAFLKAGIEAEIKACSATTIDDIPEDVDMILLAPQVSYMKDELIEECEKKGILFADIPFEIYGQMDGEGVLKIVTDLLKQKK